MFPWNKEASQFVFLSKTTVAGNKWIDMNFIFYFLFYKGSCNIKYLWCIIHLSWEYWGSSELKQIPMVVLYKWNSIGGPVQMPPVMAFLYHSCPFEGKTILSGGLCTSILYRNYINLFYFVTKENICWLDNLVNLNVFWFGFS